MKELYKLSDEDKSLLGNNLAFKEDYLPQRKNVLIGRFQVTDYPNEYALLYVFAYPARSYTILLKDDKQTITLEYSGDLEFAVNLCKQFQNGILTLM